MHRIKLSIILFLLVLQSKPLTAQFDNVHFERTSIKHGLPNGYIREIFEDHFGFLWFGTREGIFRYDGYEFKAFRHDVMDSTTLSHPNVNGILEDGDDNIWVATSNGLNRLDRRTGKFKRYYPLSKEKATIKSDNHVRKIYLDRKDNLWLAWKRNLLRFDRETEQFTTIYQKGDSTADHFIRSFYEDREGTLWAGTTIGLLRLAEGDSSFQYLLPDPEKDSDNNKYIASICEDAEGALWMGTQGGLVHWNPETKELKKDILPPEWRNHPVNYVTTDSNHNVWLALELNGLGVFNTAQKHFYHYKHQPNENNSLNDDNVTRILEDNFQNIWVATHNGISKIRRDNSGFELIQNKMGDVNSANNVNRVMQDSRGVIWFKAQTGYYKLERGHSYGERIEGLPENTPGISWDWFLEDHEGGIWFSFSGEGLYRKGPNEEDFKRVDLGEPFPRASVFRMAFDLSDKDYIWLGTNYGLCLLNWKTLEQTWFQPKDDLPEIAANSISIFEQFGTDEIWLYYSYSGSMGCFNKKTGTFSLLHLTPKERIALEGDIKDIVIGKDGNLWLATLYGLTNFNIPTKKISILGKKEGLLENELESVLIDKNDQLWVVGNRFFAQYDQANNQFNNYQISKEILQFKTKSKHVSEQGRILLGSLNGIYTFHPDSIRQNPKVPAVVLTDFKVKNESYLLERAFEKTSEIMLSYDENDITFEFSGLHYINPEANEYRCKLVGFEKEWRELGTEHKVGYTNLNPGDYTFRVMAANSDGVWNEEGLAIQLSITPPFWQTLWFELLILLVLLSIGYALFKNRQHQLALRRQKELAEQSAEYKTRFLADVSHEIRTPMNAIIGLSKLTLGTKLTSKQTKFIGAIEQSSKNLLTIINDLLDHTKLEAGKFTFVNKVFNLHEIVRQLKDTLGFKAEEKQLQFEIKVEPSIPAKLKGDPIRLNQILTNLLGNALKFTKAGKIWLTVDILRETEQEVQLKFEVGDTGIGISKDQIDTIFESFTQAENTEKAEGTGLGLNIARQLVERQGGQLFIESKVAKGTRLWFDLTYDKQVLKEKPSVQADDQVVLEGLKILIVEDTYFNQMLVVEILKKHIRNVELELAENGKIALEKLEHQKFDIILMDVKMPVLNGYETSKMIRQSTSDTIRNTPILAVTASAVPEQLEKCEEAGMDDYVTKPIEEQDLLKKIFSLTQTTNHDRPDKTRSAVRK